MNREHFESQHAETWRRFEAAVSEVEKGERGTRSTTTSELPALYRQVCQHLALARARRYGVDLERRLNHLALRGHDALYRGKRVSWQGMAGFVLRDFPRRVRAEGWLVALAAALFFGPLYAMSWAVQQEPELVYITLGSEAVAEFEEMYDPGAWRERGVGQDFLMFGYYIYNNISIAFRTFASGLFAGVGAVFILIYNGVMIGAVQGHLVSGPQGEVFRTFVITHGAFELPAIVLAGVAGLKLGLAVLVPGRRRRTTALRAAARDSLPLVYGVIGMLVIAAFVEAFWSSSAIDPLIRRNVGRLAWVAVGAYFLLVARRPRESAR